MDHDLNGLIQRCKWFTEPQIKSYVQQLMKALHYCHRNRILHRDVKGFHSRSALHASALSNAASNLLISNNGTLKLADFGLARPLETSQTHYTNHVITLWYRPPELLLGASQYGPSIDIWSAGCILGELLQRQVLFQGKTETEQLDRIWRVCGSPTKESWPAASKLKLWDVMDIKTQPRRLREHFRHLPESAIDLLDTMLTLDPDHRATAEQCLASEYFSIEPLPANAADMPKFNSSHEFMFLRKSKK
jgi:cyclin-dependent kinase 12/13